MERNEIINVLQNLAKSWFSSSQQNAICINLYIPEYFTPSILILNFEKLSFYVIII
mgnify:CR=1 FL=1